MRIVPGYPNDAMVLVRGIGGAASGQRFIIVGKFFWLKDLVTILAHSSPTTPPGFRAAKSRRDRQGNGAIRSQCTNDCPRTQPRSKCQFS